MHKTTTKYTKKQVYIYVHMAEANCLGNRSTLFVASKMSAWVADCSTFNVCILEQLPYLGGLKWFIFSQKQMVGKCRQSKTFQQC